MDWFERFGRWAEARRFRIDLATTLIAAVVIVPSSTALSLAWYSAPGDPWVPVWSALVLAPLPWRRTRPVPSAVAVYAVALVHLIAGQLVILPADFALFVALFSVTVYGPRWAGITAIASSGAGMAVLGVVLWDYSDHSVDGVNAALFTVAFGFALFLAVWAFALARRSRRTAIEALRDRAHRLEVERDQQLQIGATAERARIAREMHDIVAHSLSVIIAQADGGRYAAATDPAAAATVLTTVAETGRAALADMRRLLGVLRSNVDPGGEGRSVAEHSPQPAGEDVASLVEQVRASGMRVSYVRVGTPRPLPPGAGLTLYRICQEALTNVLKHAGPDPTVTVAVTWGATRLDLLVEDDGRGASTVDGPAGYGLVGMRERAALFGGTLTTGPRPGGGFRVLFKMPIPAATTRAATAEAAAPVVSSATDPPPTDASAPSGMMESHRDSHAISTDGTP